MYRTTVSNHLKRLALGLAALVLVAAPSFAQTTIDLCATAGSVTMPDATVVPVWGWVDITGGGACASAVATLPNPVITGTAGGTLTVNLSNNLPQAVSFFVPGYVASVTAGGTVPGHFTQDVPPGGSATYEIAALREGTYLYQSATSKIRSQLPMGLYGALVVTGAGYPLVSADQVLVYSEIDPAINAAVALNPLAADGARLSRNTLPTFVQGRVLGWKPEYFLINGKAYPDTDPIAVDTGTDALLRFVNAGLETLVPTLGGGLYMDVIAEDGNLLPAAFSQYGLELQPGKTFDVVLNVPADGTYSLYDRALNLTNTAGTSGGMLAYIVAAAGVNLAPVAVDDAYDAIEGTTLSVAAPGVLGNDSDPDGDVLTLNTTPIVPPVNGTLTLNADGSFDYTPSVPAPAVDSFTYEICDPDLLCDQAVVAITIVTSPGNTPPVAADDPDYLAATNSLLTVAAPGVLGNDSDLELDPLTAVLVTGPTSGTLECDSDPVTYDLCPDGSFTYTPNADFIGIDTFTYMANDGLADSNVATVTITVGPPAIVYFSTAGITAIPGVASPYDNADIYTWDGTNFGRFLNAVGAPTVPAPLGLPGTANVDGFVYVSDTEFYMSFNTDGVAVPGIGTVQEEDVVVNNGGVWSVYFDGTASGLTVAGQDIDAFDIVGSTLYFSTAGNTNPPGVGGTADDADLYSWNGASFARVFDGSVAGLPGNANIDALNLVNETRFCVSFLAGAGTVVAGLGTVPDEDIVCYNSGAWTLYLDASAAGVSSADNLDATSIVDLAPNAAPIAVDDASYVMNQDTNLSVASPGVLGNDTDADLDPLTAVLVTGVSSGSLTLNADGSFTYTPTAGTSGVDTFTYMANDGFANSAPATVTITVNTVVPPAIVYFSTAGNTNPPGVAGTADDADIYSWDGTAFSRVVDVTSLGVPTGPGANVDGLDFVDATHFKLSFNADGVTLPVLGAVQEEDIVSYDAGVWSVYFDGTAPGLTAMGQDLDAFEILGSVVYFSTAGNTNPPGVGGTADDADIYSWDGTAFSRVVDVTTLGLPGGANVDGLVLVDATHFSLSFNADGVIVPGVGAVQDEDIVNYSNGVWSLVIDGTGLGLTADGQDLDAIDFAY